MTQIVVLCKTKTEGVLRMDTELPQLFKHAIDAHLSDCNVAYVSSIEEYRGRNPEIIINMHECLFQKIFQKTHQPNQGTVVNVPDYRCISNKRK